MARSSLRRPVLVVLASALAVLVVAELAVRVLEPHLPEPLLYGDQATQVKVAQMDERSAGCTDVVVAGNSMARDAFDPATFGAADPAGRDAYNAALDAASPAQLERWLLDEVEPRLHPATVVVALATFDLSSGATANRSARTAYDDAEATRPGPLGDVGAFAVTHSALLRNRTALRDPEVVATAIADLARGDEAARLGPAGIDGVLGPDGEGLSRRALRYRGEPAAQAFTRSQFLTDYAEDPAQVAATRRLVDGLHSRGIDVALVVLPVTDDFVALHPHGADDLAAFRRTVGDLGAETGAPVLDLTGQARPEWFADTHHLNGDGAAWFSSTLPGGLATAGVASSSCTG